MLRSTISATRNPKIFEELRKYNDTFEPKVNYESVTINIEENDEFIGGLEGFVAWGVFEISNLIVLKRNQGFGKKLMEELELYCRKNGINKIYATTLAFQAPKFYQKMGFEIAHVIENYAGMHSSYHMFKQLS